MIFEDFFLIKIVKIRYLSCAYKKSFNKNNSIKILDCHVKKKKD